MFKKILFSSMLCVSMAAATADAATYYVAKNGKDKNSGSSSSPFLTIGRAMDADLKPGDTVIVRSGVYAEHVRFKKSGSPKGYITLKSEFRGGAKINATGKPNAIFAHEKSYLKIDGFEVYGAKQSGILAMYSHHIYATNNIAHDNAQAGIYMGRGEFYYIENNVAYRNASQGPASAIAIKYPENNSGDKTSSGFRQVIRNNVSYDNVTKTGPKTDGCGIIFDDFQFMLHSGKPYNFPSLIENNLAFGNSGRGIQVVYTDNATVRNNTVYHNNVKLAGRNQPGPFLGELSNMGSRNTVWANNIAVAKASDGVAIAFVSTAQRTSQNVTWKNNLTFDGKPGSVSIGTNKGLTKPTGNGNLFGVDPRFVNAAQENFELLSNSPAVDSGTTAYGVPATDLNGDKRTGAVDMGAYSK